LAEATIITSNVISQVAFDYVLPVAEQEELLRNLSICLKEFGVENKKNLWRRFNAIRWLFPGHRRGVQASKHLFSQCEKMLQAYRKKSNKQPHKIIHMIDADSEYISDAERISDMIVYTIAGFDTTASAIASALLELARHPKEQIKLRESLRKCVSDEEARHCSELKNVARETLRMHPPIAIGTIRVPSRDLVAENTDEKATKTLIPAESICLTSYYAIQRNIKVFANPESFVPDRWDNPSNEMIKSFMAFSLGRRSCQGQALAVAEMHEVLSKLCRKYEFGVIEEGEHQNLVLYKPVGTILSVRVASV